MKYLLLFAALSPGLGGDAPKLAITNGPILGRLGSDHIGVWIRTKRAVKFRVLYGTDPAKLNQKSAVGETKLERDFTGWVLINGLKPNTKYYYRIEGGGKLHGGSFRTMPNMKLFRDAKINPRGLFNFSFEYACGNNQTPGRGLGTKLITFKTMLDKIRDKINFAILNGDWLYEAKRTHPVAAWMKQVGITEKQIPHDVKIAPTLVGVWENYKLYLEPKNHLSTWHRNMPSFFTFDDHEMLNDVWGAGEPGIRERRAVFRDIGVKGWYDYLGWSNPIKFKQPIDFGMAALKKGSNILVDPKADFTKLDLKQRGTLHVHWGTKDAGVDDNALDEVPVKGNSGVFGITKILDKHRLQITPAAYVDGMAPYSIGRRSYYHLRIANCDFFVLDTRSHREMHDLNNPKKPGISMLGKLQREWLIDGVKKSDADFIFVVSSVNFMIPHRGGGAVRPRNKDDAWTVFIEEREKLIGVFDKAKQPVMVLTGDLHNSFAIQITDNVYEFASGPHNSNNHIVGDEGNRPANGSFDSEGRKCFIKWSTAYLNDIPRDELLHPNYCVVQVNNVYNNPLKVDGERWVAFPVPQVILQYYDGRTGRLKYAESIMAR